MTTAPVTSPLDRWTPSHRPRGGTVRFWARTLPDGSWLAIHPAPGGQSWWWAHRVPAGNVPTILAAEGAAPTPEQAAWAADTYAARRAA